MDEIVELLKLSDFILSRSEKKDLKTAILNQKFNKRELDNLRSKIFDIAAENQEKLNKEQLIQWIENTSKLTLSKNQENDSTNSSYFSQGTVCRSAIIQELKSVFSRLATIKFLKKLFERINETFQLKY
ncbi:hypothetical protein OAD50_01080 [Vicingaceae bacterium]|nr:hypothetical protein [Vicingaceae bacterium]